MAAPVINENGQCVGFFSAADFLRRELKLRQESPNAEGTSATSAAHQAVVSRFMSSSVQSLLPGEPLVRAARMMCEQHLHRVPVVNDEGRVVGIISTMDLVAALLNALDEMEVARFQ